VNPNWQLQFNTIINACLTNAQMVGRPGNSASINDIKTDEYSIALPRETSPVFKFTSLVDDTNMDFELVSVTSLNKTYLYEKTPEPSGEFNILFRNDKLGFSSKDSGFFAYFKQGSLVSSEFSFPRKLTNRVYDFEFEGINQDDTWLIQYLADSTVTWDQVENLYALNDPQNSANNKKFFAVESRFNDQVTYVFGDDVFGESPVGNFKSYMRTSNALTYNINISELQNININIPYISRYGREETLSMNLSLQSNVNNALSRESLAEIRERAPSRYYTQNRMVNGEDYNNFPFTLFGSVIKSKAINRISSGISRNMDLIDPTAKYSSTSVFADDGALYTERATASSQLTINSGNDIIHFFSQTLLSILATPGLLQHYVQTSTRFSLTTDTQSISPVKWKTLSNSGSVSTGYFYSDLSGPLSTGSFSTRNLKYVTPGCLIKVTAPSGFVFDTNNKLVAGVTDGSAKRSYWTSVVDVVGDGNNFGEGALVNGLGPVSVTGSIGAGSIITEVIPAFTSNLSVDIKQQCVQLINIGQSFSLMFDNSRLATQERFSVMQYPQPDSVLDFQSLGNNRYKINYKLLRYFFGSAKETRFNYETDRKIYDPKTGKIQQDHIVVLKSNNIYNSVQTLPADVKLNIVGQPVETDGYPDDFIAEVSGDTSGGTLPDPDFFEMITGYAYGRPSVGKYTFFKRMTDANYTTRLHIVDTQVAYQYPTKEQIQTVKYEYRPGQVFFAYTENKFYVTSIDDTASNILKLTEDDSYSVKTGRQGLFFQYKHISSNTMRVDPAPTNIIDLYLVTKSYYISYLNWLADSTDKVAEPSPPTLSELSQAYGQLDDYKMMTDGLILNSAKFKPLFGKKAQPNLRATLKVIRTNSSSASDSEIRSKVLNIINQYFSLDLWDFGDTFYFSELSAYIHDKLGDHVGSVILQPNDSNMIFGTLYEIKSAPNEIFTSAATVNDIMVISSMNSDRLLSS
jgi:hypothetical protein